MLHRGIKILFYWKYIWIFCMLTCLWLCCGVYVFMEACSFHWFKHIPSLTLSPYICKSLVWNAVPIRVTLRNPGCQPCQIIGFPCFLSGLVCITVYLTTVIQECHAESLKLWFVLKSQASSPVGNIPVSYRGISHLSVSAKKAMLIFWATHQLLNVTVNMLKKITTLSDSLLCNGTNSKAPTLVQTHTHWRFSASCCF